MSFWQNVKTRLFGKTNQDEETQTPPGSLEEETEVQTAEETKPLASASTSEESASELLRLSRVGAADGPTEAEALLMLRRARGTIREAEAAAQVLGATASRDVPESIRLACADILAARGDERGALEAIASASSTEALMFAADLEASLGDIPRALGSIERVLARNIDTPGAKERHARFRTALGYAAAPARRLDEATVITDAGDRTPFRLLREVARGGAGAVYEAEDELLARRVAFKVYHRRGNDKEHLEREARLAARIRGPGVVRVFDASPDDGWLALEWISRGSLRDVLARGDISALVPIGRWARPLARTLIRLHHASIVHADLKPANVLLREPWDPVLSDFGIARPFGAKGEGGSAGYVSPERIAGRASDPRDDIYGYGRVLEDVLHRLHERGIATEDAAFFRKLADDCIGPDERRPPSGKELYERIPQ